MKNRKVCIAVPAYGHLVQASCLESIFQTQAALLSRGVGCGFLTVSVPHVAIARNVLATQVLDDGTYSHLLFVDADIAFPPEAVLRMLRVNKAVVGCTYPAKELDVASLVDRARRHPREDARTAAANVQRYVVKHLPGVPEVVNGLCRVAGIGMGLCLIQTKALRTVAESGVSRFEGPWFWTSGEIAGPLLGIFDPLPLRGGYMPEDYSFCVRWTRCGGQIFALVTEDVEHIGRAVYSGRYIDKLVSRSSHRRCARAGRR
jgi:hypothetical protein